MQMNLFPTDGEFIVDVEALVEPEDSWHIDSRVSVSALNEATRGDAHIDSPGEAGLPF